MVPPLRSGDLRGVRLPLREETVTLAERLETAWREVDRRARAGDETAREERERLIVAGRCPEDVSAACAKYLKLVRAGENAARDLDDWRREGKIRVRLATLQTWAATHWLNGGGAQIASKIWKRRWRSGAWILSTWRYYLRGESGIRILGVVRSGPVRSPRVPIPVLRLWAVQLGLAPPRWLGGKARDLFLWRLPDVERKRIKEEET